MATTDWGIGFIVDLDGVTSSYSATWSSTGETLSESYTFSDQCPAGWYLDTRLFSNSICWSPGVLETSWPYPHIAGAYTFQAWVDGALLRTDTATILPGTFEVLSGATQTALANTWARSPLVVAIRNYRGERVSFPIQSDYPDAANPFTFSITGPNRAVGASVNPSSAKPSSDGSVSVRMATGNKTGQYLVAVSSEDATTLSSAAIVTAVTRLEPDDNPEDEEGNGEEDDCGAKIGDPINIGIGNSFQQETDYARTGLSLLEFERSYNALGSKSKLMRNFWTSTFDRAVLPPQGAGATTRVRRPDGRVIPFLLQAGEYKSIRPYFYGSLLVNGTGWKYVDEDNTTESYDAQGKWTTIVDSVGRTLTATYNSGGLLTKVTANTGETLTFVYNTFNQIGSMTDHTGRIWTYTYNGYANLTQVKEPDGLFRTYFYEAESSPFLLSGISVSRTAVPHPSERYVTWNYDAEGRATSNYFPMYFEGTELKRFDITYNDITGDRVVRDALGHEAIFKTITSSGRGFVDGVVGPGFSTCGFADSEIQRDLNMNVISKTTFGKVMQFGNYDVKGQTGWVVEAAGKPDARQTEYVYDPRFIGKPTSISRSSVAVGKSKATQYTYDAAGNLIQETLNGFRPDGIAIDRTSTFQYAGPFGQLSQIDGPRTDVSDITRFEYHATTKRLLRVTDPNGIVLRNNITYSLTGKIAAEDRPNELRVTYAYYPGTDQLKSVTELGTGATRITTWAYNDRRAIASLTFSDGVNPDIVTNFGYDIAGDLIKVSSPGVGEIAYTLDKAGNRVKDSYRDAPYGLNEKKWAQRTFDAYGRVKNLINPENQSALDFHPDGTLTTSTDGKNAVTAHTYDNFKRLVQTVQPGAIITTYGYDKEDRLIRVTDANQGATVQVYDDLGNRIRLESPDAGTTVFDYDAAGNLTGATDALGQTTAYSYDSGNRLRTIDRVGSADDETRAYDACSNGLGKLCMSSNGIGDVVSYEYDGLGRIAKQTTNAGTVRYQYRVSGNISQVTYPSQRKVRYAHNNAGQVTGVTVVDGDNTYVIARNIARLPFGPATGWIYGNGLSESRQYDLQYRPLAFSTPGRSAIGYGSYDGNSNATQRTVNGDVQGFSYDALGRLDTASGAFGARDYDYDSVGNRIGLVSDGQATNYTHQPQSNRLLADSLWTYGRDANGNEAERRATDGSGWEMTHTANNRLLAITDLQSPSMVAGVYRYNALGQRTIKSTPHGDTQFIYGLAGELLSELLPDGSVTQEYVYLDGAPIALLGPPVAPGTPYTVDQTIDNPTSDPDCSSKSASAALNGKYLICNYTGWSIGLQWPWTPPVSGDYEVTVTWAWSGAACQRYRFESGSPCVGFGATAGTWVSLGRQHLTAGVAAPLILSTDNGQNSLKMDAVRYVLVHKDLTDRDYKYVHSDALGTPLRVTDKTGILVWQASYDPFGTATVNDDPDGNGVRQVLNLRFPGQYYDAEIGLNYNYFRDYDSASGRYLQSDPIGLGGGINTYAYVGGNPISRTDPLGLACNGLGCWNTPSELGYANTGNYGLYYQAACAGGDSYACAARTVATGQGNSVSSMAGANFTNGNLRNSLRHGGSECPDEDMENIKKDLMNARVAQLSNNPNNPTVVSGQSISNFHNTIFGNYGATNGWGPFPVFGGDIPIIGNLGGWEWCSAPACQP